MGYGRKLLLEVGPLALFFVINAKVGIFEATGAFMTATIVALAYSYLTLKRIPTLPLVVGIFVLIFGGLTLYFDNAIFIKLKPTIVNVLFGSTLLIGLILKRSYLKTLLDGTLDLDETGWRKLTERWSLFFFLLAALNEAVWRTQTTDMWVDFKVFAVMPMTIAFSLTQLPLILRHQRKDDDILKKAES